jgi:hypothetical protein
MTTDYPVKVNAQLIPGSAVGLWLVKWLLAIPPHNPGLLWLASSCSASCSLRSVHRPLPTRDLRLQRRVEMELAGRLLRLRGTGTNRIRLRTQSVPDYPAHLRLTPGPPLACLVLVKWCRWRFRIT